jgi:hypothetical protein
MNGTLQHWLTRLAIALDRRRPGEPDQRARPVPAT